MYDDDEYLRSIPPFLRRCERPASARAPARPSSEPAPPLALPESPPKGSAPQGCGPRVIDLAARQAAARQASEAPARGAPAEDMAFQVILPRSVVQQIRLLAAEKNTTQRAIVLRALRLAGLWVPDAAEADGHDSQRRERV